MLRIRREIIREVLEHCDLRRSNVVSSRAQDQWDISDRHSPVTHTCGCAASGAWEDMMLSISFLYVQFDALSPAAAIVVSTAFVKAVEP